MGAKLNCQVEDVPPAGPLLLSRPVPIPCSTHRHCCLLLSHWGHSCLWHRRSCATPVSPAAGIPQQGHDQESPPGWL